MPPPEEKKKSPPSNLLLRCGSTIAVLAAMYCCLRFDAARGTGWAWAVLLAFFSVLCLREFYRLAGDGGARPFRLLGYLGGVGWLFASEWRLSAGENWTHGADPAWALFILTAVAALLAQLTRKTNDDSLANVAVTMFGVIYCSVLPGLMLHLRHMRLSPVGWPLDGIEFVIVVIFVSKVSDVGALLTGSMWGRHKLIPRLSPGKTWEGALGGLVFSVGLLQFMVWVAPYMALAGIGRGGLVLLSVFLAAAGLAGDLVESAFKRGSSRKDAGTAVPGFGGVLDLTDSLMLATPVMYFFLVACGAEYIK